MRAYATVDATLDASLDSLDSRGADEARESASAYRDATIRPLCGVCNDTTSADLCCPRCQTPLCTSHATTAGERCGACEATFDQLLDDRRRDPLPPWTLPMVYASSAVAAALVVPYVARVSGSVFIGAMASLLAACFPLAVAWLRVKRLRGRFLRETPKRRSLRVKLQPQVEPKPQLPVCAWGVAALVTSLFFFVPLMPVLAIIFGAVSLHRSSYRDTGAGKAGLAVGIVMLCVQVTLALGLMCWHC